MHMVSRGCRTLALATLLACCGAAVAADSASDLAARALDECDQGQDTPSREARKQHFERGEALAKQAIGLDDRNAAAHFAMVCNLGEMLRLDGEKLTSVFGLRRLLSEVDRTLELDPHHLEAMATKGNLLMRLPRMFGGDEKEGERLLREVVRRDDRAVTSRITLAKTCGERGERAEAIQLASQALQVATEQGRADKVAEARATLDQLGAAN